MFNLNDTILYGVEGVCTIAEIAHRRFGKQACEYYVLKPLFKEKTTIFVPTANEALTSRMRPLLSKGEINALIKAMPEEETIWIEDEAQRKVDYRQLISKGNRRDLVRLIKTLHLHRKTQQDQGKKFHISDEGFLKEAEGMINDEFALVLGIAPEAVPEYILNNIEESPV